MLSRRLRLSLAFAAAVIPLGGVVVVAGFSPTGAAPVSKSATTSPDVTVSSGSRLGSAVYLTSPTPKPSATPDNGIHVDCEKGNDDNKGTLAKPLRSIRAATSQALDAGTVIELARGC